MTSGERALLDRFRNVDIPAKHELAGQLELVEVSDESSGYLELAVPSSAPRIQSLTGFPLDGWYDDNDGTLVSLILHVAFPEGRLTALERYRVDGEQIEKREPNPADVRVGRSAIDGPGQAAMFDRENGWRQL